MSYILQHPVKETETMEASFKFCGWKYMLVDGGGVVGRVRSGCCP